MLSLLPWEPRRKCRCPSWTFSAVTVWPLLISPCLTVSSTHLQSCKTPIFLSPSTYSFSRHPTVSQAKHWRTGQTLMEHVFWPLCLHIALPCVNHLPPLGPVTDTCLSFVDHSPQMWDLSDPPLELCALSADTGLAQSWPWGIFSG